MISDNGDQDKIFLPEVVRQRLKDQLGERWVRISEALLRLSLLSLPGQKGKVIVSKWEDQDVQALLHRDRRFTKERPYIIEMFEEHPPIILAKLLRRYDDELAKDLPKALKICRQEGVDFEPFFQPPCETTSA